MRIQQPVRPNFDNPTDQDGGGAEKNVLSNIGEDGGPPDIPDVIEDAPSDLDVGVEPKAARCREAI